MRILHCIPSLGPGGAERVAAAIVKYLQRDAEIEASICVLNGAAISSERVAGLTAVVSLDFAGSLRRPANLLNTMAKFRQIVAEKDPQIIHSHLWPACRFSALALRGKPCQHVWHVHDTRSWVVSPDIRSRLFRAWVKQAHARLDPQIIAVSKAAADYTARGLQWDADQFTILHNGVDLEEFVPPRSLAGKPQAVPPVLGLAAQFRPEKGHLVLLEACTKLRESGIDFRLKLAGDGGNLEAVRHRTVELQLGDHVEFLGHVSDVPSFLHGLDVFVLPSTQFEGLPLCILEAMACGVPVIATDVAGVTEVIRDGESGLVVSPGDSGALAETISRLLRSKDLRGRIGASGQALVRKHHDWATLTARLKQFYRELLLNTAHVDSPA